MPKTAILGTARTPFGKLGGAPAPLDATDLGGTAIEAALERAEVAPDQVEHVVMGQVLQAGQGQIPSRQAQIKGGIPKEVSSETVNKVCASGIRAAGLIDNAVRAGDLDVGVAGGMESMSNAPYLLKEARFGYRMGDAKALDAMIHDGLTNPFTGKHMAHEATEVAEELEMTRADMDKFAAAQPRARAQGHRRGPPARGDRAGDDQVQEGRHHRRGRRGAAARHVARGPLQAEADLRQGRHPHRRQRAGRERRRRRARARLRRLGEAERAARCSPRSSPRRRWPTTSRTSRARPPTPRSSRSRRPALSIDDIDLFEINEAFASVAINSMRMLGVDEDKVNVNGGAIALGHPIGASGARIVGALVHELRRRGGGLGVAAICSGGGQGDAMIIEVNGG